MIFFLFAMAMLVFSGWRFFKSAAAAGKHIEAKVGFTAGGVAFFVALIEIIPKVFSGVLRTDTFSVYQEPYSYFFFLACGGVVFVAAQAIQRFLQSTSANFLANAHPSDDHQDNDKALAQQTNFDKWDRTIRATAIAFLVFGGFAGGASRWAGEADKLPFLIFLVTLPALGVWYGRRSQTIAQAIKQGAIFGAAFILPSFLFYWSPNFGSNVSALLISIGSPVIAAAIAFATQGEAITAASTDEQIKSRTQKLMLGSIVGILLPQFFQPAVFDESRAMSALSEESGKEEIKQSIGWVKVLSGAFLALVAVVSAVNIFIAFGDAL